MAEIRATLSAYLWIAIAVIVAIAAIRFYLLYLSWQEPLRRRKSSRRVDAAVDRVERGVHRYGTTAAAPSSGWQCAVRGAIVTAKFPGGLAIVLVVIGVFAGRYQSWHGTTTDLYELALVYFLGLVLLGAVLGDGMSLTHSIFVRVLIGMVAVAPLVSGLVFAIDSNHWRGFDPEIAAGMSVLFGIALAYGATRADHMRLDEREP